MIQFFEKKSTYLIWLICVIVFFGLSFIQATIQGLEKNIQGYLFPSLVGLIIGLIASLLVHHLQIKKKKENVFFLELIEVLAIALEERDKYTYGHARRVTSISLQIAALMKLNYQHIEILRLSGVLHDIGKIGISDSILLKPGKLSKEEYQLIKSHPVKGARILSQLDDEKINKIIPVIKHHHERYDGKGYPDGLKEKEIPQLSRIIAVADSYDAMTSDRPYRKGMDKSEAIKEIINGSGTQFDPEVVKCFLLLFDNIDLKAVCSLFYQCEVFKLIQNKSISKAYEVQYCRGNYKACERYLIKNKSNRETNLLPDGRHFNINGNVSDS